MGPRVNSFCSIDLLIWFPFKSPWPEPLLQNTNTCCQSKPHIKIFFFKRISGKRKESFLVSWTLETSVLQFEWVCEDESSMENVTTSVKIPPTWFHFQQLLFRVQYLPGILLYIIMSWGHWGMIYFSKKHNKHWKRRRVNAEPGEQRRLLPSVMVSILVLPEWHLSPGVARFRAPVNIAKWMTVVIKQTEKKFQTH